MNLNVIFIFTVSLILSVSGQSGESTSFQPSSSTEGPTSSQQTNPPQPTSTNVPNSSGQPTSPGPTVAPNSNLVAESEFQCAAQTKGGNPDPSYYQGFTNSLSQASISSREEAAKYLAHSGWETVGFQYTREQACQTNMESCREAYPNNQGGQPGIVYYGRGMLQLTWDYNYNAASSALYNDNRLIMDPEPVADDPSVGWLTAAWYWQTAVHPNSATFGDTLKAINGRLECDGGQNSQNMMLRFDNYKQVLQCMSMPIPPDSDGYCHV